jgi:molecular chaperone DnaK (HSP70)
VDLATGNWGYLVSKDDDPVRWFKLLLLETQDLKRDMKDSSGPLKDSRQKLREHAGFEAGAVVDLIAGFLQNLWKHTLEEINHEIDTDLLPIKVAITVPAIWPLYARERMEAAAKKAGILEPRRIGNTKLILVEEPEAAAVSTLFDRKDYPEIEVPPLLPRASLQREIPNAQVQIGESFIVCDCGGGTIVGAINPVAALGYHLKHTTNTVFVRILPAIR